jgi:hypothetical protein
MASSWHFVQPNELEYKSKPAIKNPSYQTLDCGIFITLKTRVTRLNLLPTKQIKKTKELEHLRIELIF